MKKILFCGESYISYTVHLKGADAMTTQGYHENGARFLQALRGAGYEVNYMPSHTVLEAFPDTVEKLRAYDIVILSDIGANSLLMPNASFRNGQFAPERCKVIKEYVLQGGAFMMIGGFMSFTGIEGKARYGVTPISDILPVDLLPYDDRVEKSEGVAPIVIDERHPVFRSISGEWPKMIGYNKTVANEAKGQVIAEINGDPFIAVGTFGEGRSAAYTSDCAPHWGSPDFLAWEHYDTIFVNLIEWLTEKK